MSVVSIAWRLPSCGPDCAPRQHDPWQHEAHGLLMAILTPPRHRVKTGALVVDLDARTVAVGGIEPKLTPTEREIMLYLAQHAGKIVRTDELLAEVWGPGHIVGNLNAYGHIVRVNITRLRARLGVAASLLESVNGFGYRLVMESGTSRLKSAVNRDTEPPRWARRWDACQHCRSTERHHAGRGLCTRCRKRQQDAGKFL